MRYNTTRHDTIYDMIRYNTTGHDTMQYDAIQLYCQVTLKFLLNPQTHMTYIIQAH